MKKKRGLMIGVQVGLVVAFSFSFYQYVQNEVQPKEVYVFKNDLPVNTQITKNDLEKVTIPAKAITTDFALDANDIVGKYVTTKTFGNQFVYKQQLVEKEDVDPFDSMDMSKLRKISLPVDYLNSFAGDIERGDKIDLVFTGQGVKGSANGSEGEFKYSKVFLQNVYVYNVATEDGFKFESHANRTKGSESEDAEGEKIDTSADESKIGVVTVAVTLDQAEEITARMKSGEVRLLGRFDDNQSYETLGYVVGEFGKVFSEKANAETGRATINEDNQFQK
ncbi:Flp pilus assembly protein CpaB [Bacillus sp. M6-12]|uniref:Flp pilus assembly protein CpaB n=1 Tax=Bacillus sp. M6-12 TaxID=2054166 RepID=UPI000C77AE18|nr:RcpC/CpaB family pilus assembly protein [Bacillus sp. M6-12]PLS19688.1 Flp pilus assembly protein CpaB [Bacillus sp. M6-12]